MFSQNSREKWPKDKLVCEKYLAGMLQTDAQRQSAFTWDQEFINHSFIKADENR